LATSFRLKRVVDAWSAPNGHLRLMLTTVEDEDLREVLMHNVLWRKGVVA
jgi:hypothetical protein